MIKALLVGASGYAGAEVARYLQRHPQVKLCGLTVSENSADAGKLLSDLYPQLKGVVDLPLQGIKDYTALLHNIDVVLLATEHAVSHQLVPTFLERGCTVIDLSGAYRVKQPDFYADYYGFSHQYPQLLQQAAYGLAEFAATEITNSKLIAVPGCYPTVSQLALKPLLEAELLDRTYLPIIDAISGVSGAGRKASLNTSFCEVSLQAYGLFNHRHQPEIAAHLGQAVIFTPHLGSFSRGIHATIHCRVKPGITRQQILAAYQQAYQAAPLVRIDATAWPALKAVVGTPYCDIGFALQQQHLTILAVEDNLLKGAAAQAVQCLNIHFGFEQTSGLL